MYAASQGWALMRRDSIYTALCQHITVLSVRSLRTPDTVTMGPEAYLRSGAF